MLAILKSQIYSKSIIPFKSTRVHDVDKNGNIINCNYTNMNREDINWEKLAEFITDRYRNQGHININCYAASDGSEPYTLALYLIKENGFNKAQKFFPIKAKDISEKQIQNAKQGKILLHKKDIEFLEKMKMMHYFEKDYNDKVQVMRGIEFYPYKVDKSLRKCVDFSVADINNDASDKDFSNEVVMFRNGWTFNTLEKQDKLAENLYKNSNNKTLIIIGQSDLFKSDANDALQRNGFEGIRSDIFTDKETNYSSNSIGQKEGNSLYPEFILFEK